MSIFSFSLTTTNWYDRSAATILSLLEEGSFDYGSIFTDQAPAPVTSEIVGNDAVAEESEEDGV